MKKKRLLWAAFFAAALCFSGCGGEQAEEARQEEKSGAVLQEEITPAAPAGQTAAEVPEGEKSLSVWQADCDALRPDMLPEQRKTVSLEQASEESRGGSELIYLGNGELEKLREIFSGVRAVERELTEDEALSERTSGDGCIQIVVGSDADQTEYLRSTVNIYRVDGGSGYEYGARHQVLYAPDMQDYINNRVIDVSYYYLTDGGQDFYQRLCGYGEELSQEIRSAVPKEGLPLLDAMPENWETVTLKVGPGAEPYEATAEEILFLKELLGSLRIESQVPYDYITGGAPVLTVNGIRYTLFEQRIVSDSGYQTGGKVIWNLDREYREELDGLFETRGK